MWYARGMNSPYQSPAVKTGRNTRFRRDRQADIDSAADRPGRDSSQLIRYGADLMLRSIRCGRCDEAVPLVLGDTSGRDMYDWMEAADRAVLRQKHGDHTPVLVGAETSSQPRDGDGEAQDAATAERNARVRTEPPAPVPAPRRDRVMSCPCGRGDYGLCTDCPYDFCSVHGRAVREAKIINASPALPVAANWAGSRRRPRNISREAKRQKTGQEGTKVP